MISVRSHISILQALLLLFSVMTTPAAAGAEETGKEVAVFVTIGQSNADGSAFADSAEDTRLRQWYESTANKGKLKIWYRSCKVENQPPNRLGEKPRWVVDGDTTDAGPGWLDLWYRNENSSGRTAMNMIHGFGTSSTGADKAQGRRGMEGELGMQFALTMPECELYIIKLGVSGSHISSWTDSIDDHNWRYFMQHIYKPAIDSLTASGRQPRLAGVWWMQGCADSDKTREYYESHLRYLIERFRRESGFADAHFYIGQIVGPGENTDIPDGSKGYSKSVRSAQEAVAADMADVTMVDTSTFPMQYEKSFGGYIHFNHKGVNTIGRALARLITQCAGQWAHYDTTEAATTQ